MSDQAVLLPKWSPEERIIYAKGQLDHSYSFVKDISVVGGKMGRNGCKTVIMSHFSLFFLQNWKNCKQKNVFWVVAYDPIKD